MVYLPHWPIPGSLGNCQIDYETVFERMSVVLEKLGNPHKNLPPVIHISGTNGKGSTASVIEEIFATSGYKTCIYRSPHLHHCNERIVINGEKISDSFLFEVMEEARIAANQVPLTFNEGFVIGALLAFSKFDCDIAIIECNMGGRIDATNIIENKIATVITPISFDHMEYLGDSIQRISLEKAMIMRPNTPLICGPQSTQALGVIDVLAKDQKIPTYYYDHDFAIMLDEDNGNFDFEMFVQEQKISLQDLPQPNLLGQHQYINHSIAIATILALPQFNITQNHINSAITKVKWPSRLEKVNNSLNKLLRNSNSEIWIDGAHNEAGAYSLSTWIKEQNLIKTYLIVGFSKNKCKKEFIEKFEDTAHKIIAVTVEGEPYPEKSENIAQIIASSKINYSTSEDILDAIYQISQECDEEICRIIICGSLYLARDVKKYGSL